MRKADTKNQDAVQRVVKCPHCGSDGFILFTDYGQALKYIVDFKTGERELTEILSYKPAPVFGTCGDCGKRVRIKDVCI